MTRKVYVDADFDQELVLEAGLSVMHSIEKREDGHPGVMPEHVRFSGS